MLLAAVCVLAASCTVRASTSSTGAQANGPSGGPLALSADGRFIAFTSSGSNLVPGDTNGVVDVFVKDVNAGTTTRVSTSSTGGQAAAGASGGISISADGRHVAFTSTSADLVVGDTNGVVDVFVKDLTTGTTTRVNTDSAGAQANAGAPDPSISGDGRLVAFTSTATNLVPGDTNGMRDVFVKDTATGATTRVSTDSAGGQAGPPEGDDHEHGSFTPAISADGTVVVFGSNSPDLVEGAGGSAHAHGLSPVFAKDLTTGATTLVVEGGWSPSISADGRYVAFCSHPGLAPGGTGADGSVYVLDRATGVTTAVAVEADGDPGSGGSRAAEPSISADGRFVAFSSDLGFDIPGADDGNNDVFVKDRLTGALTIESVGEEAHGGSPSISPDGAYVGFISETSNLVGGDTNGVADVFRVARG